MSSLDHQYLKTRQRVERESHSEVLALRVHRSLSWLQRSEKCDDEDGRFIFLWIAFNAAYAQSIDADEHTKAQVAFGKFLDKLVSLGTDDTLYKLMRTRNYKVTSLYLKTSYQTELRRSYGTYMRCGS